MKTASGGLASSVTTLLLGRYYKPMTFVQGEKWGVEYGVETIPETIVSELSGKGLMTTPAIPMADSHTNKQTNADNRHKKLTL